MSSCVAVLCCFMNVFMFAGGCYVLCDVCIVLERCMHACVSLLSCCCYVVFLFGVCYVMFDVCFVSE